MYDINAYTNSHCVSRLLPNVNISFSFMYFSLESAQTNLIYFCCKKNISRLTATKNFAKRKIIILNQQKKRNRSALKKKTPKYLQFIAKDIRKCSVWISNLDFDFLFLLVLGTNCCFRGLLNHRGRGSSCVMLRSIGEKCYTLHSH